MAPFKTGSLWESIEADARESRAEAFESRREHTTFFCHTFDCLGIDGVAVRWHPDTRDEPGFFETDTCRWCGHTLFEFPIVAEDDWRAVTDELPPVGQEVIVRGADDGAPDRALGVYLDTLEALEPTTARGVWIVRWAKSVQVRMWAHRESERRGEPA